MIAHDSGALDGLPCGWLRLDARGLITAVNGTLCRMLSSEAAPLVGKAFDSLLTRPSRVLFQSYLQPLLQLHGNVEEFSLAFDLGAGQTVDTLIYSRRVAADPAVPQPTGCIELVVASVRKRRSIEVEMLRIKRAADHAPGMIFQLMQLADGTCRFPYTSEAIRRMYGVTSEQASESAERLLGLLSAASRAELSASLNEAAQVERDWHAVFEVHLPGAPPRWHEAHATPRRLANGVTLWHGHCADVTDKRALEIAMADRLALEKMHQARSEFLARVSHELRTPLNGILGFAQLLTADQADNLSAVQRERLGMLTASGRRLLALVNEVLEITSIESGQRQVELQAVELRPVLEMAALLVRDSAKPAQVTVLPVDCPDGLWVQSNERRLHQVLANLLSNAIKYNRPGGTVQLTVQRDGQGIELVVADTGKGMSAEQCALLFQPFNRLGAENTAVEGHGLGLVISKHLLDLMGASLTVSSQPGEGSRFSIRMPPASGQASAPARPLPAAASSVPSAPLAPAATAQASGHVLYVEDDEVNAILMAAVLGMRPKLTLQLAASGAQAIEMARARPVDLLLIDMHLPDIDGIELLVALRQSEALRSVPAIMVSAGARQQDIDRAFSCGFVGYWTKPLDIDKTLAELDDILHRGPAVAPPKAG